MPVAIGTKVRTGDICPITGIWRVPRVLGFGHPVVAGRVMPIYSGQDVVWELILIVWLSALTALNGCIVQLRRYAEE